MTRRPSAGAVFVWIVTETFVRPWVVPWVDTGWVVTGSVVTGSVVTGLGRHRGIGGEPPCPVPHGGSSGSSGGWSGG